MTTRQVGPEGIGARTTLDLSGTERHERGLGPSKDDLLWMRERWAQVTNEALREAGLSVRIDHRSYAAQGIDREPKPLIPQKVFYAERNTGRNTEAGDRIRASYRERIEARLKGPEELARVLERQREENRQRVIQSAQRREGQSKRPNGALTREQLDEKRREYCKANAERINRKQRERRRANAEEVNRKQREWRSAHLEEARRREHQYYLKRRAEQQATKRSLGLQEPQPVKARAEALATSQQNAGTLSQRSSSPTAEQSVKNWLAYRERQAKAAASMTPVQDRSPDNGTGGTGNRNREATDRNSQRGRKNGHTL
jgi:hypothetical protein